jgi:hypothetical protein
VPMREPLAPAAVTSAYRQGKPLGVLMCAVSNDRRPTALRRSADVDRRKTQEDQKE